MNRRQYSTTKMPKFFFTLELANEDRAIALYQALAKTDPTREEPWSRIAQIQFTQGHYGQAIVAAQEALQRDQTALHSRIAAQPELGVLPNLGYFVTLNLQVPPYKFVSDAVIRVGEDQGAA